MEFEDLDEQMEWKARRIASAFGVEEWSFYKYGPLSGYSGKNTAGTHADWGFSADGGGVDRIFVGGIPRGTHIRIVGGKWKVLLRSCHQEIMARGLYRLGFEDETVLSQLPPLSAHEKMELRLSLPREFWPQKWCEEEAK